MIVLARVRHLISAFRKKYFLAENGGNGRYLAASSVNKNAER
jgi:hypothetical protein